MKPGPAAPQTSQAILDIAQRLVQTRGFNAFSYADIAGVLRITTASLHYHFASKAILGVRLIERYATHFAALLAAIDAAAAQSGGGARERLRGYAGIYAAVLAEDRSCLCGMLAAEFETLPRAMQGALDDYFALNERWLQGVLEAGRASGSLAVTGPLEEAAHYIVSTLEGSMILARSHGGPARFDAAARRLLAGFGA
ncbi:MAG: TetR/AcrR family transcriptional regulator [Rhodobacteraceae bacterium]|nr:TetR/AcrR family transcriptional regulator [Paracoccaceae bacterium]